MLVCWCWLVGGARPLSLRLPVLSPALLRPGGALAHAQADGEAPEERHRPRKGETHDDHPAIELELLELRAVCVRARAWVWV